MNTERNVERLFEKFDLNNLPPVGTLSVQSVGLIAIQIACFFKENPVKVEQVNTKKFRSPTTFFGLSIEGSTADSVSKKSVCSKYWKSKVEKAANLARLDWEAERKIVGGPKCQQKPVYCSDVTFSRYQEKLELTRESLKKISLVSLKTSEVFTMAELAKSSAMRRLNELYFVAKNLESIAADNAMPWLFVTFTAPAEYHPNPSHAGSRRSYKKELGLKASHDYIRCAWARIRSYLNENGLSLGYKKCFGFRTAETHKDGSVHWHLQIFIRPEFMALFRKACRREFPKGKQIKIVVGDESKGSAAGYIFKYLIKDVDSNELNDSLYDTSKSDSKMDDERENADLASIRHSARVKAALRSMNIRQYQLFGVGGVMTLLREINKIDFDLVEKPWDALLCEVKQMVWRAPNGLKNLFSILERLGQVGTSASPVESEVKIELLKESAESRYGEVRQQVIGVSIGKHVFRSVGRYVVLGKGNKQSERAGYSYS